MRQILGIILIAFSAVGYGFNETSLVKIHYQIASDKFSKEIPEGKCLVIGKVTEFDSRIPLAGAQVSTVSNDRSAYADAEGLYSFFVTPGTFGLYMFNSGYEEVVTTDYAFQSQHIVTINFFPTANGQLIKVLKPVIYLYSDEPVEATVELSCRGALTFTYPACDGEWSVQVSDAGIGEQATGKSYPYLFWEGAQPGLSFHRAADHIPGFLVATDTLVPFLENALTALSLNQREKTDFITFWAPRMIARPFVLIQFLTGNEYSDRIAGLEVSPQPDAVQRVFMLFTMLDTADAGMNVVAQPFRPFERKGFTVVEWGGSELPANQLIP